MTNQYYFAFGSNINVQRVEERGIKFTQRVPAFINDYELVFNKQAWGKPGETYANIQTKKGSVVEGVLYLTDEEGIKKLDKFEGVATNHYVREEMEVTVKSTEEKVKAWVYIAHESKIAVGNPSMEYLNHLLSDKESLSEGYHTRLSQVECV